jgi:hypothetical protein
MGVIQTRVQIPLGPPSLTHFLKNPVLTSLPRCLGLGWGFLRIGLKDGHRLPKMGWREMLVSERHVRVFVPKNLHHVSFGCQSSEGPRHDSSSLGGSLPIICSHTLSVEAIRRAWGDGTPGLKYIDQETQ